MERKCTRAEGPIVSDVVARMRSEGFLATETVVVVLACAALLAMVSALVLMPLDRLRRRHAVTFAGCLVAIWAIVDLVVPLIRGAL
jgi:hypothetical protein